VTRPPRIGAPPPGPLGAGQPATPSGPRGPARPADSAGPDDDRGDPAPPPGPGRGRRVTSILAALALVAVGGATAAFGRGSHPVALALSDGGGWLTSERLGLLFHVNGPSGQADAAVTLPGAVGHSLTVLTDFARSQDAPPTTSDPTSVATTPRPAGADQPPTAAGAGDALDPGWPADEAEAVIVVDDVAGTVWLVDPSLLTVAASVAYPPGTTVRAAAGEAYAVEAATGRVTRLDPRTLARVGAPLTFPAGLGTAAQTPDGTLWVPVPRTGTVVPVRGGVPGAPVPVAPAGDRIDVVVLGGSPVVVDQTAATVAGLATDRVGATIRLPAAAGTGAAGSPTARSGAGGERLLVPPSTDGAQLALTEPATGRLMLANLATGQVSATPLPAVDESDVDVAALAAATGTGGSGAPAGGAGPRLGAPVAHDGQVYVPDSAAGVVWDFDPAARRFAAPVPVASVGTPALISLDVQNGQLWINDETGPTVVLVNGTSRRTLVKFGVSLPGGAGTGTPRPLPPGPTPAGGQPSTTGTPGASTGPGPVWPGWIRPGAGDSGNGGRGSAQNSGGQNSSGQNKGGQGGGRRNDGGQGGDHGDHRPGGQPQGQPGPGQPQGPDQPEPTSGHTVDPPQPEPTVTQQPQPTGPGGVLGRPGQAGGSGQGSAGGAEQASGDGPSARSTDLPTGQTPGAGGPPAAQPTTAPAPTGPPSGSAGAPGPTASPGHAPTPPDHGSPRPPGFWLLTADGSVLAQGDAAAVASGPAVPGAVAIVPTATGRGYWLVGPSGAGEPVGDAAAWPNPGGAGTVIAAAAAPTGGGYWSVTSAGTVVPHGGLPGYGSLAATAPVVGIAATPTGGGYWLLDAAGGVHPFGDAATIAPGATPTGQASEPNRAVGIAAVPTGSGYWTVTAAGAVTAHGSAGQYGSAAGSPAAVGIASTPTGRGYWVLDAAGGAHPFGDAVAGRAAVPAGTRAVAFAAVP